MKVPSSKLQIPKNFQVPIFKFRCAMRFAVVVGFVVWRFLGAWKFGIGAFSK
jgi:hypothetical protein